MAAGIPHKLPEWNLDWELAIATLSRPIRRGETREIVLPPRYLWAIAESNLFKLVGAIGYMVLIVVESNHVAPSSHINAWSLRIDGINAQARPGLRAFAIYARVTGGGISLVSALGGGVSMLKDVFKLGPPLVSALRKMLTPGGNEGSEILDRVSRELETTLDTHTFYNFSPGWEPSRQQPTQFLDLALGLTVARGDPKGVAAIVWPFQDIRAVKEGTEFSWDPTTFEPVSWDLGFDILLTDFQKARLLRPSLDLTKYPAAGDFTGNPFM